ncbi:hypothetical protein BX661DRAFT_168720 [Kickxella alabastrina]|uniref:uncharacterized protein n=1 Tax=Kickxella alabastrina TaxID=61397 RepID=UPI00221EA762|nr:uncharacterized protein BX661DRAFT_168720 [Kickxella alabastrina]KAI7834367.1 hypothetical protein BX661DRAFT_168720 [Kickxella alabastrina]
MAQQPARLVQRARAQLQARVAHKARVADAGQQPQHLGAVHAGARRHRRRHALAPDRRRRNAVRLREPLGLGEPRAAQELDDAQPRAAAAAAAGAALKHGDAQLRARRRHRGEAEDAGAVPEHARQRRALVDVQRAAVAERRHVPPVGRRLHARVALAAGAGGADRVAQPEPARRGRVPAAEGAGAAARNSNAAAGNHGDVAHVACVQRAAVCARQLDAVDADGRADLRGPRHVALRNGLAERAHADARKAHEPRAGHQHELLAAARKPQRAERRAERLRVHCAPAAHVHDEQRPAAVAERHKKRLFAERRADNLLLVPDHRHAAAAACFSLPDDSTWIVRPTVSATCWSPATDTSQTVSPVSLSSSESLRSSPSSGAARRPVASVSSRYESSSVSLPPSNVLGVCDPPNRCICSVSSAPPLVSICHSSASASASASALLINFRRFCRACAPPPLLNQHRRPQHIPEAENCHPSLTLCLHS